MFERSNFNYPSQLTSEQAQKLIDAIQQTASPTVRRSMGLHPLQLGNISRKQMQQVIGHNWDSTVGNVVTDQDRFELRLDEAKLKAIVASNINKKAPPNITPQQAWAMEQYSHPELNLDPNKTSTREFTDSGLVKIIGDNWDVKLAGYFEDTGTNTGSGEPVYAVDMPPVHDIARHGGWKNQGQSNHSRTGSGGRY